MEVPNMDRDQKKNPFTTVTLLSKTLALVIFILFPFVGFYLGVKWGEQKSNIKLIEQQSNPKTGQSTKTPDIVNSSVPTSKSPEIIKEIGEVGENVVPAMWETYSSENIGISFSYPTNIINTLESENGVLLSYENRRGLNDTGLMRISKLLNTSTADWIKENIEIEDAQSGSYFNTKVWDINKTTFKGYEAFLFTPKENAQVPSNILSIELNGNVYQIQYETTYPIMDMPEYVTNNEEFLKNTKPIIDEILESIKFL